jgi:GNAT superfamily N-acetyltransferase
MTGELRFRQADVHDSETLALLYRQLDPSGNRPEPARVRELLVRLRSYPDYRVYLALKDDRVVGTCALLIMDTLGSRCAPEAVVEDLVVDQAGRGRGVGRAMMEFAMDRARQAGCYKLVLSSNMEREDAHRFYDAIGFRRHGVSFVAELDREHP